MMHSAKLLCLPLLTLALAVQGCAADTERVGSSEAPLTNPANRVFIQRLNQRGQLKHFYTTHASELTNPAVRAIFNANENGCWLARSPEPYTRPLYRAFNAARADHRYTVEHDKHLAYLRGGGSDEGIEGYLFTEGGPGRMPVYSARLETATDGDQLMTGDINELRHASQAFGYRPEGLGGQPDGLIGYCELAEPSPPPPSTCVEIRQEGGNHVSACSDGRLIVEDGAGNKVITEPNGDVFVETAGGGARVDCRVQPHPLCAIKA